ncbi:FCD domain-containing protein [Nocardia sp. R7R-8]|uniref:FCD domain-containing protein n=1 Tax=Nocardia sp. R7R-8 TaxID=3459304 RepID=UPI00403E27B2
MSRSRPKTTRTDAVYEQIRADILAGRLSPGTRLKFAPLCEQHRASAGVVREALSRLTEHGLVCAEPQIGFRVIPISVPDLQDLTEVRGDIECLALRYSIERGDIAWESRLIGAHHALQRTPRLLADDPSRLNDEWVALHATFHAVLLEACGSPRLTSIALSLREAAELYRRWSVPLGETHDSRDVAAEHREIFEAAIARDPDRAIDALSKHIRFTTELVLAGQAELAVHNGQPASSDTATA